MLRLITRPSNNPGFIKENFKWLILVFPVLVRDFFKNDVCSWVLISVIDLQCIVAPKEKTAKSKEMFVQLFIT